MASLGVAVAAFGLLTAYAMHPVVPGSFDAQVHDSTLTHRHLALVDVARVVTLLGSGVVVVPVVVVSVWLVSAPPTRDRLMSAAVALAVLATGSLARLGVSVAVGRHRPPAHDWATAAGGYAFPSGHTTSSALAAGVLAWMTIRRLPERRGVRVAAWSLAALFAIAVGLTRVYLGVHWPTDVIGGWLFAIGWLSGWALLIGRRRPVEPPPR